MSEKKMWLEKEITCKPLDTYDDILAFLQDPPLWRTLCVSLTPHSKNKIKNIDINPNFGETLLEVPQTFCHYDPETENVRRQERKKLPKILVCHDMANGYHDDCIIDGTGNYDSYTFYNWGGIDIFCYFSHHLVTIPPLAWINVGHAHGVKVIGTIITEWATGVAFWDKILSSEVETQNFARALVDIAKTLKFDGWLLNVENKIAKPEALLEFVRLLHATLHQQLEDPVLIWYDSVTVEGHLNWQNELNQNNRAFFDVVDGFFTNYSWNEANVESSALMAGDRLTDLFIGIDVWGRNFYGGGKFNTQEAIQVAHEHGCSIAIFAPAWTHEAICDDKNDGNNVVDSEELSKFECFMLRDRALWGSIWPYLNTSLPCSLPFQTSFCRGQGKKRRLYGEVICPRPWFNLRHMQYQPNSSHGPHGYLVSTQDNIQKLSAKGWLRDKAATTGYRRTLEACRVEIYCTLIKEAFIGIKKSESTPAVRENQEQNVVGNEIVGNKQTHNTKSRVKNYFRQMFRTHASKNEENRESGEVNEIEAESSELPTQPSATRTSVKLQLEPAGGKTRYGLAYVPNELECLEPFYEDSFTGGSCLKVNPSDLVSPEHRLARIFHCDFYCDTSLIACVVTKTMVGHEQQSLNVTLSARRGARAAAAVLVGREVPRTAHPAPASSDIINVYPCGNPSDPYFRNLQRYMLWNESGFYTPVENSFGWKVRYYAVPLAGARLTAVSCRTGLSQGPILLGHFGICSVKEENVV